ncbi:hypothetical protein [Flagellimonas sp.]|jgi:hypothetical protein|uniref:hypothetical protein n=1 Tax=Flagellimonas sp. TaxID=2058762 RepID=UPI003BAA3F09
MSEQGKKIQTTAEVLSHTNAIPQQFYATEKSLVVYHAGKKPKGKVLAGAVVSNNLKPGNVGFVTPMNKKGNVESMIAKTLSNNEASITRRFSFVPIPNRPMQMGLHVQQSSEDTEINGEVKLLHDGEGSFNLLPIIVGPDSVGMGEPFTEAEIKAMGFELAPEINWGSLLKGVAKAIPVLAETGLSIYKEVTSSSNTVADDSNGEEGILGIIGSIAKVAVPFVSAIL